MSQATSPRPVSLSARIARFLRFRILTLLIIVSLICGWLAWTFHREPITPANALQLRSLHEISSPGIFKLV